MRPNIPFPFDLPPNWLARHKPRKPDRLRSCYVSMTQLAMAFTTSAWFKVNFDLPQGAKLVRWFLDPRSDGVLFVFEHESFPEHEEGAEIAMGPPGTMQVRE